jgi:hypothetical protein
MLKSTLPPHFTILAVIRVQKENCNFHQDVTVRVSSVQKGGTIAATYIECRREILGLSLDRDLV